MDFINVKEGCHKFVKELRVAVCLTWKIGHIEYHPPLITQNLSKQDIAII